MKRKVRLIRIPFTPRPCPSGLGEGVEGYDRWVIDTIKQNPPVQDVTIGQTRLPSRE